MPAPHFDKSADIERKDPVPDDARTPERDDAADYIEEMWPADLIEIADAAGYSRQHIRNTLDLYFNYKKSVPTGGDTLDIEIPIPDGVDGKSYARGYLAGRLDEREG